MAWLGVAGGVATVGLSAGDNGAGLTEGAVAGKGSTALGGGAGGLDKVSAG